LHHFGFAVRVVVDAWLSTENLVTLMGVTRSVVGALTAWRLPLRLCS